MIIFHTVLPSPCAHQKSCFCSHLPRVMTRHNTQHSRMSLSRVHRISRRLPDTLAICSVQITIFTSRRAARICEQADVQNFFFFSLQNTRARLTLCARYSSSRDDKTGWTGAIATRAALAMLPYASLAVFPAIRGGSIVDNRLVRTYRVINDGRRYSSE